jgi:hypothetical protein
MKRFEAHGFDITVDFFCLDFYFSSKASRLQLSIMGIQLGDPV